MRIRAVRLADLGCFRAPVAIEGLSGALDVLAGPNEIGKSTIFRAIEAAFLKRHTTTAITDLAPRGGGEPLIEVDFEAAGRSWRVTKRFSSSTRGRLAELADLATGRVEAKGPEAESRLDALIGRAGKDEGRFGLLWVAQDVKGARDRWHVADSHRAEIEPLIEAEVMAVAGGSELARVRRRVIDRLAEQTTRDHRRPKAHSPYALALAHRDDTRTRLVTAREKARAAVASLDQLVALRQRLIEVADPDAQRRLADGLQAAETQLRSALEAQTLHSEARAKAGEARRARDELARFDLSLDELGKAAASAVSEAERIAAMDSELAFAATAVAVADGEVQRLSAREQELAGHLRAIAEAEAADMRRARHAEAMVRLAEAGRLAHDLAATERDLAAQAITAEHLARIEQANQDVATREARLSAAAPTVAIEYLPGRDGTILAAGTPVPAGPHKVVSSLVLEVPGIGRIRIEAGAGLDAEHATAELASRRNALARLLAQTGAADLAGARAAHARRRDLEQQLEIGRRQLSSLAPKDIATLTADVADLARDLPASPQSDLPTRAETQTTHTVVRSALMDARSRLASADQSAAEVRGRLQQLKGAAAARAERLRQLEASLPPAAVRADARQRLVETLAARDGETAEAERRARALAAVCPTDAEIARLDAAKGAAAAALKQRASESEALARAIERLEGELEEAYRSGGGRSAVELEGEAALAEAEVDRHERELAGLRLLAEEIDKVEREQRDRYLKPVSDRLDPYLAAMFPSSRAQLGEKLAVSAIERAGLAEALDELSGGTQEQIAVLVRLAFARLLADNAQTTPVILDDALVYSDDDRIARLFGVLDDASRRHQVIVLTCRARSVAGLGGSRLELTPWRRM